MKDKKGRGATTRMAGTRRYAGSKRGGTGKLPMAELRQMCEQIGFGDIRTYIASGNVVFRSDGSKQEVKALLEGRLVDYAGKPLPVFVRTATELRAILDQNPFSASDPKRTVAILRVDKPPKDALVQAVGQSDEEMRVGKREIDIHYPSGIVTRNCASRQ